MSILDQAPPIHQDPASGEITSLAARLPLYPAGFGLSRGELALIRCKPSGGKSLLAETLAREMKVRRTVTGRMPGNFLGFQDIRFNLSAAQQHVVQGLAAVDVAKLEARIVAAIGAAIAIEVEACVSDFASGPPRLSNYEPDAEVDA